MALFPQIGQATFCWWRICAGTIRVLRLISGTLQGVSPFDSEGVLEVEFSRYLERGNSDEEEPFRVRADCRDPVSGGRWMPVADLCQEHGISTATLYNWCSMWGLPQSKHDQDNLRREPPPKRKPPLRQRCQHISIAIVDHWPNRGPTLQATIPRLCQRQNRVYEQECQYSLH